MQINNADWVSIQINFCKESSAILNRPATDELIKTAQDALGFLFPDDFINFYKTAMDLLNGVL